MLEVQDLDTAYGEVTILRGVSLTVAKGESVSVIGANGAGKSTLLRAISGLLRPRRGAVLFDGRRIDALQPYEIAGLGIAHVPEGRRVLPEMTVEENLELGAYLPGPKAQRRQSLAWIYTIFPRLADRRRQRAGTLSGGEQQMLAVGRGLMLRPRLLMLDEPSLGLAPLVVDATFQKKSYREMARGVATKHHAIPIFISCTCPDEVVRRRLEERLKKKSVSDGRWEIYHEQKKTFEPFSPDEPYLTMDTSNESYEYRMGFLRTLLYHAYKVM
jgi:branched-chain amino acid transport system ATP-binding protein